MNFKCPECDGEYNTDDGGPSISLTIPNLKVWVCFNCLRKRPRFVL